jgi:hypothetical protein
MHAVLARTAVHVNNRKAPFNIPNLLDKSEFPDGGTREFAE